jgi:phage terminase large subunit GpA-like protein
MATVESLIAELRQAFRPPRRMLLSEWARENAYLSSESSAEAGRWQVIAYQTGIMDAFVDPAVEQITVMKSARVGYTKIINNAIGYHIHQDPCPMMVVQPTVEDAEGYSKEEIAPMFRDTPCLRGLVESSKTKDSSNTILQKSFPGGTLSFVGANSGRGFRRVSRRIVFFDETDGYPVSIGAEGDPIKLGIRRTEYYWNRKIVAGSTPTIKDLSKIENLYGQSDQRRFFVPCPHCGEFQYLKFGGREKPFGFKWPEGKPLEAFYVCENGCRIEHSSKREMVERGEWRATAVGAPRHAGFHIWAAYSFSPNATWGNIASEFLASVRDTEHLRTFVNTVLGETWEEKSDAFDAGNLKARLEEYPAEVPHGVGLLVGAVDVQGDRLEWVVKGYGDKEESWLIASGQVYGDPAKEATWLELDKDLKTVYTHESGRKMPMRAIAVDSGGLHTDHVYKFCKPREDRTVDGLSQHVYAIKGVGGPGREMISKPTKNNRYKCKLWPLGVDTIKDTIFARLHLATPGPGYIHLPTWTDDEYLEQLTAEKAVKRYKKGVGTVREYIKIRERNEGLDLEVYALAALLSLGRATVQRLAIYAAEMSVPLQVGPPKPAPAAAAPNPLVQPQRPSSHLKGYGKGWVNSWKK